MKKIILSLLVAGTISMNAQDVTGFAKGNIALSTGLNYGTSTTAGTKTTDFGISPMAMYMTTANWGIRGGINYKTQSKETAPAPSVSTNEFGIGAGARYFFTPANRLSFFLDAGANASFPTNVTNFGLNFNPGVNYFIHKNWAFGADFNLASFKVSSPSGGDAAINFDIAPTTNLGGLNFTLMYVIK